jgi:hypothetical protein
MEITHDSIRAAGGIVHGDGNIFFRDIGQLHALFLPMTQPSKLEMVLEQCRELQSSGSTIAAVKHYRNAMGSTLKEAHDAVVNGIYPSREG